MLLVQEEAPVQDMLASVRKCGLRIPRAWCSTTASSVCLVLAELTRRGTVFCNFSQAALLVSLKYLHILHHRQYST